jgi:quercetin 2,3-dioxygenase
MLDHVTDDNHRGEPMSFEFLIDPQQGPQWKALLPGRPAPFVLRKGEGEHSMLFTDLFTVLLSGDETNGQFGVITSDCPTGDIIPTHSHDETHETFFLLEGKIRLFFVDAGGEKTSRLLGPGDFGYVPAGTPHAYRVEQAARILGVMTGGFERFFQHMGTPTDHPNKDQPPFIPDFPRMQAAAGQHRMKFLPDYQWPDA